MGTRKYWIGCSDEDDKKPTDFDTFLVDDQETLVEAQANIAEWIAEDYLDSEGESDE